MEKNLTDDHGYEDNENMSRLTALDLISENSFLKNKKIFTCYWEAPAGTFSWDFPKFGEIGFVIDGELVLTSSNNEITLNTGDSYHIPIGETVRFKIISFSKLFIVSFPIDKDDQDIFQKLIVKNKK